MIWVHLSSKRNYEYDVKRICSEQDWKSQAIWLPQHLWRHRFTNADGNCTMITKYALLIEIAFYFFHTVIKIPINFDFAYSQFINHPCTAAVEPLKSDEPANHWGITGYEIYRHSSFPSYHVAYLVRRHIVPVVANGNPHESGMTWNGMCTESNLYGFPCS